MTVKIIHVNEKLSSPESSPADRFRVNPADYPIFAKQYELDERWGNNTRHTWNIDKTLSRFVTNTANLISTLDGSSTEYTDNPEIVRPDHVIYLDKSARPVSWLVNTFWNDFSDQPRPEHSYLNIDRLPWFRKSGIDVDANGYSRNPDGSPHRNGPEDFHIENISPDHFARLRALFLPEGIKSDSDSPDNLAQIMQTPSTLDGKNILVVDEVARSGSTLKIATELLRKAFPTAKNIRGAYFWPSGNKTDGKGEYQMLSVPVWYDSSTPTGRGAGDIDQAHFEQRYARWQNDKTRAQHFGSEFLSALNNLDTEPDRSSRELMHEIKLMREDYDQGHILLQKPRNYSGDRFADLIEDQGIRLAPESDPSPDTYINMLKEINSRPPSDSF